MILLFLDQASGITIILAIGNVRPDLTNNSNVASKEAVSELFDLIIGLISSILLIFSVLKPDSCVFIQLTLPFKVLISPL